MEGWIAVFRRGWVLEPSLLNMRPALPPQRTTRPPRARALGMPAARLPTWPGRAWLAPARHRSGAPEARFALLALAPPAVPRESTVRSRNQPEMCLLTAPHGSAKRTVSPHQPLSRSGSPLGGFIRACCVSVEVIRARVGAARVPFWVSFIPVMKYKPTLPRARTRAALLDSLAPAPSHAPHEIGGCDPESAQRCRWRAHHTHPSCLHHSCTYCPVWSGRGARSGMAARLN